MSDSGHKLQLLREQMEAAGVDYYWVPSSDCHFNEYVPDCWQRRRYLSGFTGSAGSALIGRQGAWLWTDSRYFLQAQQQLDPAHWQLMREGTDLSALPWLLSNAPGQCLAMDSWLMTLSEWQLWQQQCQQHGLSLKLLETNLVDLIWQKQPELPKAPLARWSEVYAGLSAADKLENLKVQMATQAVDYHVITSLDSIAWLCNCRGADVACNPVFIAYAIIHQESAVLYLDCTKVVPEDRVYLQQQGFSIKSYEAFSVDLPRLSGRVWLDPKRSSIGLRQLLGEVELYLAPSPVYFAKAVKNPTEQLGMREAHRRDGVALVRFFAWLEQHWQGLDEVSLADKLLWFRQQDPHFRGMSFPTICGYADHGAIVHYLAAPECAAAIDDKALILLDSGGQYDHGTTDVTRTFHMGEPTEGERHHYTLVLKGHLALRHVEFPLGTCGEHLDVLARAPLWAEHLQYGHGTGHGVGCYLNVHEGPQRISPGITGVALQAGMVVSNEPGVYFSGRYGIRIENLVLVEMRCGQDESATGDGPFLGFADLTVAPYSRALIDQSLLSEGEIAWVNDYHQQVYAALCDDLNEETRLWLQQATLPL